MSSIGSLIIFIVVFVLLFWVIRQMKGNEQFDERQLLGRYKACRSGFFAFMIVIVLDAVLKLFGMTFYEDPLGELAAIFVAVLVFAGQAIRYDAFIALNTTFRYQLIVFIIVCLSQLVNAISQIISGTMIRDGRLTLSCLSILCVITFAAIIIMMLIHQRMTQEEA